jgi:transposase
VKENFANAVIVYDKFHVVSQVSQAVEEVRRKEARQDAMAREQLEKTCCQPFVCSISFLHQQFQKKFEV